MGSKETSQEEQKECECSEVVRLLSLQRHEFFNHLQVVSGLLQLKKAERAMNYIRSISCDELSNQNFFSRNGNAKCPKISCAACVDNQEQGNNTIT